MQVISCNNLEAKDRSGYSDPCVWLFIILFASLADLRPLPHSSRLCSFVVVSLLGNEFRTPVCKHSLNPVYAPKDMTFEFPIFLSLVDGLDLFGVLNLKFVVWHKNFAAKNFLGKKVLPVNEWFKDNAFAFHDQRNQVCPIIIQIRFGILQPLSQPIDVVLLSSSTTTIRHGSMRIKVGFVDLHSTSQLDFWNIYNTLVNRVLPVGPQADHVGIVKLLIWGAAKLPDWPTGELFMPSNLSSLTRSQVTNIGWDMDPYVKVRIGDEVQSTQVIWHDRNPVWNRQLVFHVRERDLSLPIRLSVFDRDKGSRDDHVGDVNIHISELVGTTSKKDRSAGFYSDGSPTMIAFNNYPLFWSSNSRRPYNKNDPPTLTFR